MVEMMFVVALVGILAAVAVTAYSRNVTKAHAGEVPVMFGEFKAKEDAFYAENGSYLALCPTPTAGVCAETDFYPATLPGKGKQIDITTGDFPATWSQARIAPGKGSLYCQYVVVAGPGGTAPAGTLGQDLWGGGTPPANWFYSVAQCDWDGNSSIKALSWQRGDQTLMGKENDMQ
jgi:type II secretory pathway pseudopilin PulG